MQSGAAAATAPLLAKLIKEATAGKGEAGEVARIALHTLASAVLAKAQGGDAGAGAAGGFIAAAGTKVFARAIYGKDADQLAPDEKMVILNLVAALSAAGGGAVTGDTRGMVSAGNAARVEVENNALGCSPVTCLNNSLDVSKPSFGGGMMGAGGGAAAGAIIADALKDDDDKGQPNVGKDLTDAEKAELGGAGSGTPGGWEPQDEEYARNSEAVKQQQQNHFDELSKLYDKSNTSQNLNIDGQTIRQGEMSNNYGTTKVFESQNLTDQQIHKYAQQLAGEMPLREVRPGIYTSKLSDGSVITLRNVSTSEAQSGARWTIDIRNSQKLSELGNKYSRVEIKFK